MNDVVGVDFQDLDTHGRCAWAGCGAETFGEVGVNLCAGHAEKVAAELVRAGVIPRYGRVTDETEGWVYFVQVGELVKIGWSSRVRQRMHQYPPDSTLLALYRGTKKDEKQQHQDMAAFRAKGREWYRDHHEVRERVAAIRGEHGTPSWTPWKQAGTAQVSLRSRSGPGGSYVK